jgi:NAD(P)-dependent dehydrogenase (short-subunit alcohol dehydrogenase family)
VQSGARVVIWDLNRAHVDGASTSIVDVTNADSIRSGLAEVGGDQSIDLLVNSAGYLGRITPFVGHGASEWRQIVEINLLGHAAGHSGSAPDHAAPTFWPHHQPRLSRR